MKFAVYDPMIMKICDAYALMIMKCVASAGS